MSQLLPVLMTALLGAVGALGGWALGLPAPFVTGPATVVSLGSLAGLRLAVPLPLRDGAFVLVGIGLGTGITSEVLARATAWPVSLVVLAASLTVLFLGTGRLLQRLFGLDRITALLSACPGHVSFVLSLSSDTGGDTTRIALIQSLRVLALTLIVPLIVSLGTEADLSQFAPPEQSMALVAIAALMGLAVVVGWGMKRLNLPAAYLLGGMAVSLAGHVTELTPGALPLWLSVPGFTVMGMLIGTRFVGVTLRAIGQALAASGVVIAMATGVALATAVILSPVIDLPVVHILVAFAPGGLEVMAALAILLGVDPAYVAVHHVFRLLFLSVLVPTLLPRPRDQG